MDALTQQLMQQLSGDGLSKISQQIGADEQTTDSALSAVIPLLVTALAKNSSKSKGAKSLRKALIKDHNGSILNNVAGFLGDPQAANGIGILKHILGGQQSAIAQGLAEGIGLDSSQVGQLLQIAAPLLMGMLGQQHQQQSFNTNDLAAFLGNQQQMAQQSNPDLMSMLNNLLDANQSGSALDDIVGMVGKLFKRQ